MLTVRTLLLVAAACIFGSGVCWSQTEPTEVTLASIGNGRTLTGWLLRSDTPGKSAAVVFLHGCSGLAKSGRIFSLYTAWAELLTAHGYAVLMVDSAGARGYGSTCGPGDKRGVMYRERPGDAYAALAYLQRRQDIDPENIFLMGWSQGGGIVLLTMNSESIGRPEPPPRADFKGAVAFYPGACSNKQQSSPFTTVQAGTWTAIAPLLILHGAKDNWTKLAPCLDFVTELQSRGESVSIIVYPNAVHAFDAPGMAVHERRDVVTHDGETPLVGTDETARQAARKAVLDFLHDLINR